MSAATQATASSGSRRWVTIRGVQIALGVIWLLDGLFQFKSFMFTHNIVTEVFAPAAEKQWSIVGSSMTTFDHFYGRDLTLWNSLSGEIQCAIGLGLICSKRLVKPALLVSFAWSLVVWWFGEGFGGLTSNTMPSPLMGAPGAVILYAVVGLMVYPSGSEEGNSPSALGRYGDAGGKIAWSGLWALSAGLWLANVNRTGEATYEMIKGMAEASPHWLAKFQNSVNGHTHGHGSTIAILLAIVSAVVAVGVWIPALRWPVLIVGIVISLAYWVFGQDLGGPFWAESATDVNAGPLFVLMAVALFPILQTPTAKERAPVESPASAEIPRAGVPGMA